MKTIQEAIFYYRLNPEIAVKIAKKMNITEEMTEMEYIKFINATLNEMQKKIAKKFAKRFGYKPSKAMKAIQAMCIFDEKDIDYEEFFERCSQ